MKSYATKLKKVCENFLRFQAPQNYPYSLPLLQKVPQSSNFFSLFSSSTKINHYTLLKESCENEFFLIQIKSYVGKRKPIMI